MGGGMWASVSDAVHSLSRALTLESLGWPRTGGTRGEAGSCWPTGPGHPLSPECPF